MLSDTKRPKLPGHSSAWWVCFTEGVDTILQTDTPMGCLLLLKHEIAFISGLAANDSTILHFADGSETCWRLSLEDAVADYMAIMAELQQ